MDTEFYCPECCHYKSNSVSESLFLLRSDFHDYAIFWI